MRSRKPEHTDPDCTEPEEGFYARWSRRKRRARGSVDVVDNETVPRESGPDARAEVEEPPPLTDADMPPLESLHADSDFSGFMSPGVSEELRNKALRKLFLSAQFNVVDGLDDYDDDFTMFEALGDIVTSDMRHQHEMAEQRAREAAQREANDAAASGERDAHAAGKAGLGFGQGHHFLSPGLEAAAEAVGGHVAFDHDDLVLSQELRVQGPGIVEQRDFHAPRVVLDGHESAPVATSPHVVHQACNSHRLAFPLALVLGPELLFHAVQRASGKACQFLGLQLHRVTRQVKAQRFLFRL